MDQPWGCAKAPGTLSRDEAPARSGEPHAPEVLQDMRNHLEEAKRLGIEAIND
jgi:hypothetical protein